MGVVLITGCSSGFGHLTALAFAGRGDRVVATMRDLSKAVSLRTAAGDLSLEVVQLDVTDSSSIDRVVDQTIRTHGRIDVLVNNAAFGTHGPVESYADDEVARVFDTNVTGVVRMARAVARHMRERRSVTIVNISSLVGKVTAPLGGVYAASKHAVEALSDAMYFELLPFGVRVIVIEPGAFTTSFHDNRLVPRAFSDDSPYRELERRFGAASSRLPGSADRAGPELVANTIVDAVSSETPQRRYLVGRDAETIVPLHKRLSDEEFERVMRETLGVPQTLELA